MGNTIDPLRLIRSGDIKECVCVTRTNARGSAEAGGRRYLGVLMCEVRVGVSLVVALDGLRRLVTSTIRKVEPVSATLLYVETSNSRYRVRRVAAPGEAR